MEEGSGEALVLGNFTFLHQFFVIVKMEIVVHPKNRNSFFF
jgi:hypothetical protein